MCERTWTGCPQCGATTDEISWYEERYVTETATIDGQGYASDYGEPEYGDICDSGYRCDACGHTFNTLDEECSDDECDCRECDPETAITQPEEDDHVVLLRRTWHADRPELHDETPAEVVKLFSDRAISVVPVRAARAAELYDDGWVPTSHAEVDLTTFVPDSIQPEEAAA